MAIEVWRTQTTSYKNVETLSRKNNLSSFKSLLVTGLWDKILTSPLPPFKVIPPSFEHGLVLLATLKRGGGGCHKHKIMDKPFKPKYGTVSQVLLQLVVAIQGHAQNLEKQLWMGGRREVSITSHRPVTSSDLKHERLFFCGSVSTFCNWL